MNKHNDRSGRILLTAATATEGAIVHGFLSQEIPPETSVGTILSAVNAPFDLLISGVGIAATTFHLTKALHTHVYHRVIHFGVAGAYGPELPVGSVVQVIRDRFSDFGAEHETGLIPAERLPFTGAASFPYVDGWLEPTPTQAFPPTYLDQVSGITSDTVHTTPASIQKITTLFQPDLETMEGAAPFYVCMWMDVPCLQIRAVSNMVGARTPENWNLELALMNLHAFLNPYLRKL